MKKRSRLLLFAAVLTGIPAGHGEPFNILRYEQNQHYDSHYDSFDEESYGKQASKRVGQTLVYLREIIGKHLMNGKI